MLVALSYPVSPLPLIWKISNPKQVSSMKKRSQREWRSQKNLLVIFIAFPTRQCCAGKTLSRVSAIQSRRTILTTGQLYTYALILCFILVCKLTVFKGQESRRVPSRQKAGRGQHLPEWASNANTQKCPEHVRTWAGSAIYDAHIPIWVLSTTLSIDPWLVPSATPCSEHGCTACSQPTGYQDRVPKDTCMA